MNSPVNFMSILKQFGTDEKCRTALENLRWPKNITCPKCDSAKISRVYERGTFDCDNCRYQFSVTSGTMLHDTHLPITVWFYVTYVMCESKKGISANQIKRMFGVSYKTAWYLCHRIRAAMLEIAPEKLGGTVEIDETYVGGKARRWRPKSDKAVVIGIRQRNGELRLIHARDAKSATVQEIINANVGGHVEVIMTDEYAIYPWALKQLPKEKHKTINHTREYAHGDIHTNTIESAFSLLKRGIVGTWHKVSAKHLPAYLDEIMFRFNNRNNQFLFRDTLIKLILSPNLEYKNLTAKVKDAA